jgi:hypothetical protein
MSDDDEPKDEIKTPQPHVELQKAFVNKGDTVSC